MFTAKIGVDEFSGTNGSLVFEVWDGQGRRLFQSPVMRGQDATRNVSLNIAGASYLKLVVTDAGDGLNWDHAVWGDPELTCGPTSTVGAPGEPYDNFVADMYWSETVMPHWMAKPQRILNFAGTAPVRIDGKEYDHGIGAHGWSIIRVPIGGKCTRFQTDVGIDDTAGNTGLVRYSIWGDNVPIWSSGDVTGSMAAIKVDIDVSKYTEIALTVSEVPITGGDADYIGDHASWGDPRVTCTP